MQQNTKWITRHRKIPSYLSLNHSKATLQKRKLLGNSSCAGKLLCSSHKSSTAGYHMATMLQFWDASGTPSPTSSRTECGPRGTDGAWELAHDQPWQVTMGAEVYPLQSRKNNEIQYAAVTKLTIPCFTRNPKFVFSLDWVLRMLTIQRYCSVFAPRLLSNTDDWELNRTKGRQNTPFFLVQSTKC